MLALCAECGAPRSAEASRCARCGGVFDADTPAAPPVDAAKAARGWSLARWATLAFVLAGQATQWVWIAHRGSTALSLLRAAVTLLVGVLVGRSLVQRNEVTLVVWGWVMNASAVVMALTFAGAMRWARLTGFEVAVTAWAWVTVVAYAVVLRGVRRVVLGEAVR